MAEDITAYALPEAVRGALLALASDSHLLLFGELHGTQEVPRLLLGLLPALAELGYGGLALELPMNQREHLLHCVQGAAPLPFLFGTSDFRDGRLNVQSLSLISQAVQAGWHLLCFDPALLPFDSTWADRDAGMADNLLEQWEQFCPGQKVLGVCGNFHSRLAPTDPEPSEFWPSFASATQRLCPDLAIKSIKMTFGRGAIFNGELKAFDNSASMQQAAQAELRPERWGHSADLYLPEATAATFPDL